MRPQTIQIYLPSGDPAGIRTAQITTRTVVLFEVPRTLLSQFRALPEAKQVGIYFLFGTSEDGRSSAYIGQSGNVGDRIRNHDGKKDFWDRALVAVSLTNSWTNTHVGYMEWESLRLAAASKRYEMTNGNEASNPHTPEPLKADCGEFLETISVLLTTLGYPILEPIVPTNRSVAEADTETLIIRDRQSEGRALVTAEGWVVLAGASGLAQTTPSVNQSIVAYRKRLIEQGAAEIRDNRFILLQDHLFNSPSTAGTVIVGGNLNGRTSWKNAAGVSYKELEERQLTEA
ncbi:GIY-YIG nuclease family protein [Arthrobacter sp. MDT2-16]